MIPTEAVEAADRLAAGMVEATTEYDFVELPDYLRERIRRTAYEFLDWQNQQVQPVPGELVNELGE